MVENSEAKDGYWQFLDSFKSWCCMWSLCFFLKFSFCCLMTGTIYCGCTLNCNQAMMYCLENQNNTRNICFTLIFQQALIIIFHVFPLYTVTCFTTIWVPFKHVFDKSAIIIKYGDMIYVVPASGFSFIAQQIWKAIKDSKDLGLPAHKVFI